MVKRGAAFNKLNPSYFFAQIAKKRKEYEEMHPDKKVVSLGIGDAVLPLVPALKEPMHALVDQMLCEKTFIGYGPSEGWDELRAKISQEYGGKVEKEEVFVTNGAKGVLSFFQSFFSHVKSVGIITPSYPVYTDGSILHGAAQIHYLPMNADTGFYYDLEKAPEIELLYLCHPNNPTGHAMSKQQLTQWVKECKKRGIILIVDAAYSAYVSSETTCRSIYEIEGADQVAIEIASCSKSLGFSGVRGGWAVVPKALKYEDGNSVHADWSRFYGASFNGANMLAQQGMLSYFDHAVKSQAKEQAEYYMENARTLKRWMKELGFTVYGGEDAPYVWVDVAPISGWEFFHLMLEQVQIIVTPGEGFGKEGAGFVRLSAFVTKENLEIVGQRLFWSQSLRRANLKKQLV